MDAEVAVMRAQVALLEAQVALLEAQVETERENCLLVRAQVEYREALTLKVEAETVVTLATQVPRVPRVPYRDRGDSGA